MDPIKDYAIIGDCRAAALVSRSGSIDWLCWPHFDSPSIFGALLDDSAGRWRIAPRAPFHVTRRYVGNSNVLQMQFETATGTMRLTDTMPVVSEDDKRKLLLPDHQIIRMVEVERGELELEMTFTPRPQYGRGRARLRQAGKLGTRIETDAGLLMLQCDVPVEFREGNQIQSRFRLRAGDARCFSLIFEDEWPAVFPPLGGWTREAIARSTAWWNAWAARLTYHGPGRDAVIRSALALRLLVYAPTGAIVAAPTTALPERVGGDLNWDYRFCWLRDASLTLRALLGLGYTEEAEAFANWLLHTTALTRPTLRVLYDVYGMPPPAERTLDHLAGYRGSRPVRIGNAASEQLQLDVYGEVIDAVTQLIRGGGALDRDTGRMLSAFGTYVCRNWQQPDEGIWESRSGKAHHTHSRVLCWTALDRLVALHAQGHLLTAPVALFERNRDEIRKQVEDLAWNPRLESYVGRLDGDELDASLLLMPWYGFEDAGAWRMTRTYARIQERLGAGHALLYRYRTDESSGEGAFGICSFWGVEYLAMGGGTAEEAQASFEQLLTFANDVGLFAEEIDPTTGEALGNFPQAFTHVGLINAALSLQDRLSGREPLRPRRPDSPARG